MGGDTPDARVCLQRVHTPCTRILAVLRVFRSASDVDAVGEMHTTLQKRFGRHVRIETIEDDRVDSALRLLRWHDGLVVALKSPKGNKRKSLGSPSLVFSASVWLLQFLASRALKGCRDL